MTTHTSPSPSPEALQALAEADLFLLPFIQRLHRAGRGGADVRALCELALLLQQRLAELRGERSDV